VSQGLTVKGPGVCENVSQGLNVKGIERFWYVLVTGVRETVPQGSNVKGSEVCERFYIGDGPQGSEHVVVVPEQMGNVVNPFWS
jgi:hypothetical protein